MNKVQKFLQTMKHNWDWSISGSKKFEKAMLQVAEDLLFVKVNKKVIEKYKDKLKPYLVQ